MTGFDVKVVLMAKVEGLLVSGEEALMCVRVSRDKSSRTYPVPSARATGDPNP